MSDYSLQDFIQDSRAIISEGQQPASNVQQIVPLMQRLLNGKKEFLQADHFIACNDHYARNLIYLDPSKLLSLYALVWQPGQWTPIHDHGTWGVVGVHEGVLEERNFMRGDTQSTDHDDDIKLLRAGVIMLPPNAVTSFVPNPDHIHITGNPSKDKRVVSLHLYGNAMAGFHVYDAENKSREWIEMSHNES